MTKKTKLIFTLSILLNLVLLGVIGGGYYKMHRWHQPPVEMSAQGQEIMKDHIQASRESMRAKFKSMRGYHQELQDIISAEEFDRAAYDAVVEKVLTVKDSAAHQKASVMGDTLAALPQEDRQKMAKAGLRLVTDGGIGHKKRGGHGKRDFEKKVVSPAE